MQVLPIGTQFTGHLQDESRLAGTAEYIAFPQKIEELAEALSWAGERGLSVTIQGAKTGISGGAVPRGGLILNLSQYHRILGSFERGKQRRLWVQAGLSLDALSAHAASLGCFFPPNPTESSATIGGVFATGAAGPSSLLYKESSRWVQALRWLTPRGALWEIERGGFVFDGEGCRLPDGTWLEAKTLSQASPVAGGRPRYGLDLIDFLAGSEGRLGIAAELCLSLLPLPRHGWAVVYFFSEEEKALAFGDALYRRLTHEDGRLLVCAEFFDGEGLSGLEPGKLGLPEFPQGAAAAVYTELAGDEGEALEGVLAEHLDIFVGLGEDEENTWAEEGASGLSRFRQLRHALSTLAGERPGFFEADGSLSPRLETDFSGPPSMAADYVRIYRTGLRETGLGGMVYGHLLQNRLHTAIFCTSPQERERAKGLIRQWAEKVMADGGFLISENGVGKLKTELAKVLMSKEEKAQRRAIKDFFDPEGRLDG